MKIVVDANVLVAVAIPLEYSAPASAKLREWIASDAELFAPTLWSYEAVSAVRKFVAHGQMEEEAALEVVSRLLRIRVRTLYPDEKLHHKALIWAGRLSTMVAYDAAYMALAEHLEAQLWTADKKLVNRARDLGVNWIREIAELAEG